MHTDRQPARHRQAGNEADRMTDRQAMRQTVTQADRQVGGSVAGLGQAHIWIIGQPDKADTGTDRQTFMLQSMHQRNHLTSSC